ncbi:MAG: hypothetical protein Greene07147_251 [Parcubacteria group bacterium Greene0714_7]|nr:MAG: hypothetical protein Greene07147_251 [Parcubacteria group bacterium Greene0714_7]
MEKMGADGARDGFPCYLTKIVTWYIICSTLKNYMSEESLKQIGLTPDQRAIIQQFRERGIIPNAALKMLERLMIDAKLDAEATVRHFKRG